MSRLLRVELTRLRWRRAVVLLTLLPIVLAALLVAVRAYETRPLGAADVAEAQRMVEEEKGYIEQGLRDCIADPQGFGLSDKSGVDVEQFCADQYGYVPEVEDYLFRSPLSVAQERTESGLALAAVLAVVLLLVGTTYVGHDWSTGSMSNQLLFEPRRLRVWAAKAAAVAVWALVLSVVVLAAFWGALLLVARSRGIETGSEALADLGWQTLRTLALTTGAAVGGYALTTLTRSTVFTVAALAVLAVAGGLFFGLFGDGAQRFEPATNASALVTGVTEYYVEVPQSCYAGTVTDATFAEGGPCDQTQEVHAEQGAVYYGLLLLVVGAASAASYRRRDVP